MKRAFQKDIRVEIRKTMKRFLSIAIMAFLGVGMYVGIKAACYDMRMAGDTLFDKQNLYDIEIISTLGLTEADVKAVAEAKGIEAAVGSYSQSAKTTVAGTKQAVQVHTLLESKINEPYVVEGKLPQRSGEIAIIEAYAQDTGVKVGDTIELEAADIQESDEDLKETTQDTDSGKEEGLKLESYTVTAIVGSPVYTQKSMVGTVQGNAGTSYQLYVTPESVSTLVYTEIYVMAEGMKELDTYSDAYAKNIEETVSLIEGTIMQKRQQSRYEELKNDANIKIQDAQRELDEKSGDASRQLEEATQKLSEGTVELEEKEQELSQAKQQIVDGKQQIDEGKQQIADGKAQIEEGRAAVSEGRNQIAVRKQEAADGRLAADSEFAAAQSQIDAGFEMLKATYPQESEAYQSAAELLVQQQQQLELQKQQTYAQLDAAQNLIAQGEDALNENERLLEENARKLERQEQELFRQEEGLSTASAELSDGERLLLEGKAELEEKGQELSQKEAEFLTETAEAQTEIDKAQQSADEMELAKWYVLTREGNAGYTSLDSDTESIAAVGSAFPFIFFLVAVLISLTTMTRMVDEQRGYIGTLKALGYTDFTISMKYVLYAFGASLLGCVAGNLLGFFVMPHLIWNIMTSLHILPEFHIYIQWQMAVFITLICIVCIIGATALACFQTLHAKPAQLMRAKAPRSGSRVLLERIPFFWKHLKFLNKVTARNLFRYKKRMLMTIIGILCCNALLVTGFGLRDSMEGLLVSQYEKLNYYDMIITTSGTAKEREDFGSYLQKQEEVKEALKVMTVSLNTAKAGSSKDIPIFVIEDSKQRKDYIGLYDTRDGSELALDQSGFVITENAANLLALEAGDSVSLKNNGNIEKEAVISGIAENYLGNYIYMTKEYYQSLYGDYEANGYLVKMATKNSGEVGLFSEKLEDKHAVASVTVVADLKESFGDKLGIVNQVVYLMIIMAGVLAFVVLYTLSNINIEERLRELATIKVLGFYDKEVYRYVMKESDILTGIGAVLGLPAGYALCFLILFLIKIPDISFRVTISPYSYALSLGLTILFELIVNRIINGSLKRINMVEALKSIE